MQRVIGTLTVLGAVIMGQSLSGSPVYAQGATWPTLDPDWTAPRTAWDTPDLHGIWSSKSSAPMQRSDDNADREFLTDEEVAELDAASEERETNPVAQGRDVRGETGTRADVEGAYNNIFSTGLGVRYDKSHRTSRIIDPPNGKFPALTSEGEAQRATRAESFAARAAARAAAQQTGGADVPYPVDSEDRYDHPEEVGSLERCRGVSIPCIGGLCGISRLAQGPASVTIYYEQGHGGGAYRKIPLDERPHLPSHIRQWLGDSVGHWEGDTLVVDTTNFTNQTSFQGSGEGLHLIERFTRVAPDLLQYQITVEDTTVWSEPWTMELALEALDNTENLIFESACHEGNYSLTAMLAGARIDEAREGVK
jgi:hypothetical protein